MRLYDALQLSKKEMVCFVGAGGKTSLMLRLASECAAGGGRVLVTTTTKMYRSQFAACCRLILARDEGDLLSGLGKTPPGGCIVGAGAALTVENKVTGLSEGDLDLIYEQRMFDYVLVEADGARGRPFKAPGEKEPVLPSATTCVLSIVGADALGRPLTERHVHRSDLAAEIAGQAPGSPITGETVLRVMRHYARLVKQRHSRPRFIPVFNRADDDELRERARSIALGMLPEFERVLITSTLWSDVVREVVM